MFDYQRAAEMAQELEEDFIIPHGFSFAEFSRIHKRTLLNGASLRHMAYRIGGRVPHFAEDLAWWMPTDAYTQAHFGYQPTRIVYKDARDLPIEMQDTEISPTLH